VLGHGRRTADESRHADVCSEITTRFSGAAGSDECDNRVASRRAIDIFVRRRVNRFRPPGLRRDLAGRVPTQMSIFACCSDELVAARRAIAEDFRDPAGSRLAPSSAQKDFPEGECSDEPG
jgi:hypothetical protein